MILRVSKNLPRDQKFSFIDLFAGIGGMRTAATNLGGNCVFASEWDRYAQIAYQENYGHAPVGDIREVLASEVPEHDVLLAGFPCQAFSIAGKRGGFEDTRGTLFFDVARIIKEKQPKLFLLENVKGLTHHDSGRTLATILRVLRDDLGYLVPDPQVVNAKNFGVPQNRERVLIVGFRRDLGVKEFAYPSGSQQNRLLSEVLEKEPVSAKYYLSTRLLETLRAHKVRHNMRGNGFGMYVRELDDIAGTLVVGGMGRERNLVVDTRQTNLIPVTKIIGEVNKEGIRRLTPREWARLQGFPDDFKIVVSDAQAYKQFGNSVAIPAIQAVLKAMLELVTFGDQQVGAKDGE
jgi:DNA (cytosine-5)-methyltransferase 1